jgi:hypothetical protein
MTPTTPQIAGAERSPLTDSNRRPPPYHGGALPTELRGRSGNRTEGLAASLPG